MVEEVGRVIPYKNFLINKCKRNKEPRKSTLGNTIVITAIDKIYHVMLKPWVK